MEYSFIKNKSNKTEKKEKSKTTKVKRLKGASSKVKKLTTASIDDILGFGSGISAVPSKPIRDPKKCQRNGRRITMI